MKKANRSFLFFLSVLTVIAIVPHPAQAQTASNPPGLCKAGTTAFPSGSAGISVVFPVAWPSTVIYSVAVQQTNAGGYSGTTACTYFNVLQKSATQFQVQHKRCDTGAPLPLTSGVSIDWFACPRQ